MTKKIDEPNPVMERFLGKKKIYVPDTEVERLTGRKRQTLANDRSQGRGIPYVKCGHLVRYDLEDVINFMEARKITPTPI